MVDDLRKFATPRELEILDAIKCAGSNRAAARELELKSENSVRRALNRLRERAKAHEDTPNPDPWDGTPETVLDPYLVRAISTLEDGDGEVKLRWKKASLNDQQFARAVKVFVETLAEPIRGLSPLVAAPKSVDDDLLAAYVMGDPHYGLYAWADESGQDFDLAECERLNVGAIDNLVGSAPAARTALLLNGGDYFHANDSTNATPGHGNKLDVDTRYKKVMGVGIRALKRSVLRLLEKHEKVIVWNLPGNHDPEASVALDFALEAHFDNNPRVTIDMGSSLHKYLLFGKVLIGGHHGHATKQGDLPLLMATDKPHMWAGAEHRSWLCFHIHHASLKEYSGCTVETFRTMAAKDAWHANKGYRSVRDMSLIIYDRELGEVQRNRCGPAQVKLAV